MSNHFKISFRNILFYAFICLYITGCNEGFIEENNSISDEDTAAVVPKDLWIADAEAWTSSDLNSKENYILYSSFSGANKEIEMHFDTDKRLYLVKLLSNSSIDQNLFCEDGRIVFSNHTVYADSTEWMAAYANGKAYAAAKKRDGEWESCSTEQTPVDFNAVYMAIDLAGVYQKKELENGPNNRILNEQNQITANFATSNTVTYFLNVRKGDRINIDLADDSQEVYFIIEPNNGSNMELRNWDGIADKTGDMAITMVSLKENSSKRFTLITKITSQQNQEIAQAL